MTLTHADKEQNISKLRERRGETTTHAKQTTPPPAGCWWSLAPPQQTSVICVTCALCSLLSATAHPLRPISLVWLLVPTPPTCSPSVLYPAQEADPMDHITGFPDLPAPAWALQDLEGKRRERMENFFSTSSLLCRPPSCRLCGSRHDRGFPPLLASPGCWDLLRCFP